MARQGVAERARIQRAIGRAVKKSQQCDQNMSFFRLPFATQPLLVGEQATITHLKAQIFLFHTSPNSYTVINEKVLLKT